MHIQFSLYVCTCVRKLLSIVLYTVCVWERDVDVYVHYYVCYYCTLIIVHLSFMFGGRMFVFISTITVHLLFMFAERMFMDDGAAPVWQRCAACSISTAIIGG